MVRQSRGIKKSEFIGSETVSADSFVDFFGGGLNTKIKFSDFISQLGVTGTISQEGPGTPLLDPQGQDNKIRSIEDGPGIKSSINPQNGVKLEHNFTQDTVGVPLVSDPNLLSPVFPSFVPGTGIDIAKVDDVFTISATGGVPATKVVSVNQISDFPPPVGGVINLEENTIYLISNNLTTSNRFELGDGSCVIGFSFNGPALEYTGVGTMFTAQDVEVVFKDIRMNCPNGTVWNVDDATGLKTFSMDNVQIDNCDVIGSFTGLLGFNSVEIVCRNVVTNGFVFGGANYVALQLRNFSVSTANAAFVGIDLGTGGPKAISNLITVENGIASGPLGSVFLTGEASNGNLSATGKGEFVGNNFTGDITPVDTIDVINDVQWRSINNQGVSDTKPASLAHNNTLQVVTISAANTPENIAGVWIDDNSAHFTENGSGLLTYIGFKPTELPITASISADPVSGTNKDFTVYVSINGSTVIASGIPARASSGDKVTNTVLWQHMFQQNDTVQLQIENNTDNTDFNINQALRRVN